MLRPLHDNVVIEPIEVEKKTSSGIILTGDSAQPTHAEGVVVAVGPGKPGNNAEGVFDPVPVAVGDRVIYGGYSQNKIDLDGKELVILPVTNILAVVEESK